MAIKPTLYPDWAVNVDGTDNDVVDGTTGELNVVAPSAPKKLLGWEYNEKPPYQYFNWLSRLTTQWIRWFEALLSRSCENVSENPSLLTLGYLTSVSGMKFNWRVMADVLYITIGYVGTHTDTAGVTFDIPNTALKTFLVDNYPELDGKIFTSPVCCAQEGYLSSICAAYLRINNASMGGESWGIRILPRVGAFNTGGSATMLPFTLCFYLKNDTFV